MVEFQTIEFSFRRYIFILAQAHVRGGIYVFMYVCRVELSVNMKIDLFKHHDLRTLTTLYTLYWNQGNEYIYVGTFKGYKIIKEK